MQSLCNRYAKQLACHLLRDLHLASAPNPSLTFPYLAIFAVTRNLYRPLL